MILIAVCVGLISAVAFFSNTQSIDAARLVMFVNISQITVATIGAVVLALSLNQAGRRGASNTSHQFLWIPWLSSAVFLSLVLAVHYGAWVPVEIAVLLASPCVLLPPLVYCVAHPQAKNEEQSLLVSEDLCRVKDAAFSSPLIREFRQRYPLCRAYLYRYKVSKPHSAGGLILHNHEKLPLPNPANIEVSLHCPFARKPGVLVEGKENLQAYLARHSPQGTIVVPLPAKNWEEWLRGFTKREWVEHLSLLDGRGPSLPNRGELPKMLNENTMHWQTIVLT